MAWTVITGTEDTLATEMQSFADESGTSSIDGFDITSHKDNQIVALVEYTEA